MKGEGWREGREWWRREGSEHTGTVWMHRGGGGRDTSDTLLHTVQSLGGETKKITNTKKTQKHASEKVFLKHMLSRWETEEGSVTVTKLLVSSDE